MSGSERGALLRQFPLSFDQWPIATREAMLRAPVQQCGRCNASRSVRFHQRSNAGIAQETFAESPVNVIFQFDVLCPRSFMPGFGAEFLIGRSNASRSGGVSGTQSIAPLDYTQQMFPFTAPGGGHGIPEPERYKLNEAGPVAVRQITASVPAAKTLGPAFFRQGSAPLLFLRNKPTQMFTLGMKRRFHLERGASFRAIQFNQMTACGAMLRAPRQQEAEW